MILLLLLYVNGILTSYTLTGNQTMMILLVLLYVKFTSFTLTTGNQTRKISWFLVEPNKLMQTPQVLWIRMKSVYRQQR